MKLYNPPVNTIITGDCAIIMAEWESDCIDLTVTSPPYDNLRDYEGYHFDFKSIAAQLWRVTKPGGVVVWVVGDKKINGSESGTSFRQALHFIDLGFNLHDTMIYRKKNGTMGGSNEYLQEYEYMFVLSKGNPQKTNLIYDRKNVVHGDKTTPYKKSDKSGSLSERHIVNRHKYGRRKNIWSYSVGGAQEIDRHPAPFPEDLARDHIVSWSNPGDTVLDPMCGSGTTLKMAVQTDRNYIGIDMSEKYCEIARKRAAIAMPPLFISDM